KKEATSFTLGELEDALSIRSRKRAYEALDRLSTEGWIDKHKRSGLTAYGLTEEGERQMQRLAAGSDGPLRRATLPRGAALLLFFVRRQTVPRRRDRCRLVGCRGRQVPPRPFGQRAWNGPPRHGCLLSSCNRNVRSPPLAAARGVPLGRSGEYEKLE